MKVYLILKANSENQNKYIISNGVSLAVKVFGKGNQILVYLHGLTSNKQHIKEQLEPLKDDFKIITFDARGHGKSSPIYEPSMYNRYKMIEDLNNVVNFFKLKDFYLGGESMGSIIALLFYLKYPKNIRGLILTAPAFGKTRNPAADQLIKFANNIEIKDMSFAIHEVKKEWLKNDVSMKAFSYFKRIMNYHEDSKSIVNAIKVVIEWLPLRSYKVLEQIDIPVLILAWDDDPLHPIELAKEYYKSIKRARLEVIPNYLTLWGEKNLFGRILKKNINDYLMVEDSN